MTTKQTRLEDLIVDIWSYLFDYLCGSHFGRLKMTGSNGLWKKISFPGLVKSVIVGDPQFRLTSQADRDLQFPLISQEFLNSFPGLEKLAIRSENAAWWSKLGLKLSSVPATIRELRFTGNFGQEGDFFAENGATLFLDKHVPHLEILELGDMKMSNYDWMALSPPSLTRLSIYCWNGQVALPSSLIFFESNRIELENSADLSLPPRLQSIIANTIDNLNLLIPLFPTSLSELKCLSTKLFSFSDLPMSLTSFKLPIISGLDLVRSAEIASQFPRNLTELEVVWHSSSESWPFLPKNLQTFTCNSSAFLSPAVRGAMMLPLNHLPPSITELKLLNPPTGSVIELPNPDLVNPQYFPPGLTALTIPGFEVSPDVAKLLPSTLTHLNIYDLPNDFSFFPSGLKKLTVRALQRPNLIQILPKSLIYLDMKLFTRNPPVSADEFPPNLTHLRLRFLEQGDFSFVQKSLTCLHSLTLHVSTKISDSSMHQLPSTLTSLDLSQSHLITGKCFPLLPRQLTTLNLGSSRSIDDSDVQHLPRTLKVLYLNSAVELTDKCIPYLPRELTLLNLEKNEKVTPDSFPNFPSALRTINQSERAIELATWGVRNGEIFPKIIKKQKDGK